MQFPTPLLLYACTLVLKMERKACPSRLKGNSNVICSLLTIDPLGIKVLAWAMVHLVLSINLIFL